MTSIAEQNESFACVTYIQTVESDISNTFEALLCTSEVCGEKQLMVNGDVRHLALERRWEIIIRMFMLICTAGVYFSLYTLK